MSDFLTQRELIELRDRRIAELERENAALREALEAIRGEAQTGAVHALATRALANSPTTNVLSKNTPQANGTAPASSGDAGTPERGNSSAANAKPSSEPAEANAGAGSDDEVPMMKGRCFTCGLAVRIYKADQEQRPESPARGTNSDPPLPLAGSDTRVAPGMTSAGVNAGSTPAGSANPSQPGFCSEDKHG